MFVLIQIAFIIGFVLSSPWYLLKMLRRGDWKRGFWQRFGIYDAAIRARAGAGGFVWIQACSVGETRVALLLIDELRRRWPQLRVALSTTTSTGQALAEKLASPEVLVLYFPLDFFLSTNSALNLLRPRLVIVVETEVWPTLVLSARRHGIPVALINGRLSEKSFRGYRRLGVLARRVFGEFGLVCAQGSGDAQRYRQLGARAEAVCTTGSMKFDEAQKPSPVATQARQFLNACGADSSRPVWVCGSTFPGEEEIVLRVYRELKAKFPALFLVLVPRHPERASKVFAIANEFGVNLARKTEGPRTGVDGVLLDTTGELKAFYEAATVIFVGKSLRGRGGQNIIEAAVTGAPVLFGPAMQNFEAVAEAFVRAGAAVQVENDAALRAALEELLAKPERRREIGARAVEVVAQSTGATARTVEAVAKLVTNSP